ncbi:MAG: methylmalonyl Co-A mutase-associated GTPase MeaB [Opitutales bacterium]|nr:methylmalonyl Co-A mutase-associated GTPase MeaB [Opitutales bacterium]
MNNQNKRPEWVPENADKNFFTTSVMPGINLRKDDVVDDTISTAPRPKRRQLSLQDYKDGVLSGNKTIIARAITLIESNSEAHFDLAQQLIAELLPYSGKAYRIGITGVPGAGKSSFIETFGSLLCDEFGKKVAVLAVDPSSPITGGSILGDKTRMENLSRNENAFIRPSPSGGMLGGVARKSRETMVICEAAGYDVILVETVGVGQSEVTVRSMTDFFLLVQLAAQGDELQGIKKGVIELADGILVNKCDGNMVERSMLKKAELSGVLHFLNSPTPDWKPFCEVCSAHTGMGVREAWKLLDGFREKLTATGYIQKRRGEQKIEWFQSLLEQEVLRKFYNQNGMESMMEHYKKLIANSEITAASAVKNLMSASEK